MTTDRAEGQGKEGETAQTQDNRVSLGDQACPRCRKYFTVSYWSGETLVQARCLSCDLKWPRPDVV